MKHVTVLEDPLCDESPPVVAWPDHFGVDGLSSRAARAPDGPATAARAVAALHAWLPGLGTGANAADLADAVRPERFPYADVLAHYHAVGRAHAAAELTGRLRSLDRLLREAAPAGDRRMWPLPEWLPSTVDQETGSYDSYLATGLLESLTGAGTGEAADRSTDALLGALAADLALTEADALQRGRPSQLQLQRTRGCLVMLSRLGELAPKWAERPVLPATAAGGGADGRSDSRRVAETTGRLAAEVWQHSSAPCRLAVELATLPTTPLHDELMFIRCVQIFETLYRQVYRSLVRASAAMREMDVAGACAELADATGRVELSPVLYRVVTTMPRAAFAIIREYTDGRSAIQSRPYRQIHLVCAPPPPSPAADRLPRVEVAGPTLQESFLAVAPRLNAAEADRLAGRMRALDASWRAMKRTHWGVTLKIIGKVPGTGGTAGAEYLRQVAEIPLFPELPAR